jgi:diguanylate cyclase (GGDEF)-like protein/PAS domain S-box-containing protein
LTATFLQDIGFRDIFDAAPDAMAIVDPHRTVIAVNRAAAQRFGWTEEKLLGQAIDQVIPTRFQRVHVGDRESEAGSLGVLSRGPTVTLFARRQDGQEFPVEISQSHLGSGTDASVLVTIRDLTEWRRAQDSLYREKEQAVVTLESIGDGVVTTDAGGMITYLNPAAERLTGWRAAEALRQPVDTVLTIISDVTRLPIESATARCLREARTVDLPEGVLLLRRDGTEVAIADSTAPIHDRHGATIGVVLVFHDVTEKRRVAHQLAHTATHDALTGLVNRTEFLRRLTRVVAYAADAFDAGADHALCYLDLDGFKLINDTCGHEAGDELLQQIASLMSGQMRRGDTLARVGGDEFCALLVHCGLAEAEEMAEKLCRTVGEFRFASNGERFSPGVSIGVVPITAASGRAAAVLRTADAACYAAKDAGRNRVHVARAIASSELFPTIDTRRATRLSRALDEDRFQLYAQRIVPLKDERPARHRCEILLRLRDEQGVLLTPESFLPQAERYNLMPAIDRWVLSQTIALLGQWHRTHPTCELPLCSINLSASSLAEEFAPLVREQLAEHGVPAESLCFEITEGAALGNLAHTVTLVSQIRATGCSIALQDFGTGLTSFAYLKSLPVDFVKISGHYVRGVAEDPVYGTLVSAVNQISGLMGIATIAEEVDNEAVLQKLKTLGVSYAQGTAVASPEPLADAEGALAVPCYQHSA